MCLFLFFIKCSFFKTNPIFQEFVFFIIRTKHWFLIIQIYLYLIIQLSCQSYSHIKSLISDLETHLFKLGYSRLINPKFPVTARKRDLLSKAARIASQSILKLEPSDFINIRECLRFISLFFCLLRGVKDKNTIPEIKDFFFGFSNSPKAVCFVMNLFRICLANARAGLL